jgi:hypothetical protein
MPTYGAPGPGYDPPTRPDLGQPTAYGQPTQGYGGYPAPEPPGYGYQQYGAPPAPPKKSNPALIIAIVVVLVLLGGGGAAAAILLTKNKPNPVAGSTSGPPNSSGATTPPANSGPASLSMPTTIGTLTKASDQSTADTLRTQLSSSGISNPYAIAYQDKSQSSRRVVVWGGTGSDFAGDDQVRRDAFFRSGNAEFTGETVSNRAPVPTGAARGSAECETVTGNSSLAFCVWVGNDALLGLIFQGYSRSDSDALAATVLSAVVSY